ncbi:hypothetical protein MIR68_006268 [Amoeboaphelidium protococcarum]|nr:hypothetical protein MIR68_009897 [Amoeboaphelidium protococcarum]KAI3635630.1 hypothetical protein MIR68_006268 [Amoeboaphelidium protococcarum]KAI3648440.1 hypothetical protein MP228_006294 [Amoeboaphelidium protococcarum]KAI3655071.1 hypothetical protein MP228_000451 [Amoeboaphelidium protococcarum]
MVSAQVRKSTKFSIDASQPVNDQIFDIDAYEKYLRDRVKVNGVTNNLSEGNVVISRSGSKVELQSSDVAYSKRYLKYLTKKFLKKHQLRDWLRVVSADKDSYVIKYFNVDSKDDEDGSDAE